MRIEVKEKGPKEFYQEVVNVQMQYKKLMKNPEAVLEDNFKSFRKCVYAAAAAFAVVLVVGLLFGFTQLMMLASAILWVAAAMLMVLLNKMNKTLNAYLEDKRTSVFIIDEKGVAMIKDGMLAVRHAWDQIAFVRSFNESTCFIPRSEEDAVIAVINTYSEEIREELESNDYGVKTIFN